MMMKHKKMRYSIEFDNDQGYTIVDNRLLITIASAKTWSVIEKEFNAMKDNAEILEETK